MDADNTMMDQENFGILGSISILKGNIYEAR